MILIYLKILIVAIALAAGQILLKKFSTEINISSITTAKLEFFTFLVTNIAFWTALLCYGFAAMIWILVIKNEDLNTSLPLVIGISLVWAIILEKIFFKVDIAPSALIGTLIIIFGVSIIAYGKH